MPTLSGVKNKLSQCNLMELPNIHVLANVENTSIHALSERWKEKDANIQDYVLANKMFTYSTKDPRLTQLLDKVEKFYGFWLLNLHSKSIINHSTFSCGSTLAMARDQCNLRWVRKSSPKEGSMIGSNFTNRQGNNMLIIKMWKWNIDELRYVKRDESSEYIWMGTMIILYSWNKIQNE
jgi:hypothetical protein